MSEIQTYKFYAGNRWHEPSSEKYFESEDPSIGKVWAKVPDCNEKDINLAVSSAKRAYYDGPYGICLLYTSPSPRDTNPSRMPSSA